MDFKLKLDLGNGSDGNDLLIRGKNGTLSSQEIYMALSFGDNYVKEILYEGTRGNGKTHGVLLEFFLTCLKFSNHNIKGIFFRRRYSALGHALDTAEQICRSLFKESKVNGYHRTRDKKPEIIIYRNGKIASRLMFRTITSIKDYDENYHGHEYQWICFDEISTWANMDLYSIMKSCLRYTDPNGKSEELPLKMRATTNPHGIGLISVYNYFKKDKDRNDVKAGVIQEEKIMIGDGEFITNTKCYLFGTWIENTKLQKTYAVDLAQSVIDNPAKLNAWLVGVPDFSESGMFCDLMIDSKIMLDSFVVPDEWVNDCFISYDDGTTSPFSVLWCVKASTNKLLNIGNKEVFIPKGSVIVIDEIYGSDYYFDNISDSMLDGGDIDLSIGCRYVHSKIAELINERNGGYIKNILGGRVAECGPADTSIKKNDRGGLNNTVYDIFSNCGLNWKDAYKGKGSRVDGASVIRNMLKATVDRDTAQPHLYFVKGRTRFLVHNLKDLKRDPNNNDDILDENRDHDYDALRYFLSFKNGRKIITGRFNLNKFL